jgi:mono/diheme cytochrome c family protein
LDDALAQPEDEDRSGEPGRRRILALLAAAVVVVVAACGGGHARTQVPGRAIFAGSCSGCHSLTGHDTSMPGGDLAVAKLSTADIASFVRVMPVRLSAAQVEAVAAYVHAVAVGKRW